MLNLVHLPLLFRFNLNFGIFWCVGQIPAILISQFRTIPGYVGYWNKKERD